MAVGTQRLTAREVASARYTGKARKLYDGGGLHLHVTATARTWRVDYRIGGKPRVYTIGPLELVSLAEARERLREAKRLLLDGRDPVAERRRERAAESGLSVGDALDAWYVRASRDWSDSHATKAGLRLQHVPAAFRARQLVDIDADDVLTMLEGVRDRSSQDVAHRVRSYIARAFDEPAEDAGVENVARHPRVLRRLGPRRKSKRFAHTTSPTVLAGILRAIDAYAGHERIAVALWLLPRLMLRPGEVRAFRWADIDLDDALVTIPADDMKSDRDHLVPLPRQAVARLRALADLEGTSGLVFPSVVRRGGGTISENTLSGALARVDVSRLVQTCHGFRHTASSMLNERTMPDGVRYSPDAIEAQLAHAITGTRGVYNRADYLDERRRMLQAWADYLDELVAGQAASL